VNSAHARRLLVAAALLGFVLRAAFGLIYWQDRPLTHDEREYLALAANVAAGRGFEQDLPNVAFNASLREGRMPSDVPDAVKVVQSIVGALGVLLIGAIGVRVGGFRTGVIAAFIAAVYPPLVWICAYALSEALFATLALACVWWLMPVLDAQRATPSPPYPPLPQERGDFKSAAETAVPTTLSKERTSSGSNVSGERTSLDSRQRTRSDQKNNPPSSPEGERGAGGERGRLFIGGLLIGLAVLTRPAMLFFVPFVLLLAWRRGRTAMAIALVAGVLAAVLPWTARNAVVYGKFVLVASEGGVTFWTGNHREARGEGDLAANPHLKQLNQEFRARHRGLTEEQLEPIYYREALSFIAEAPMRWLGLVAKKLFYTWVPIGPSYRLHSPRYFWTSVLAYGALLPVAVAGFITLWRSGRQPWTLWALAGSTVVVALLFFPQERFRIPVIDPTLILCAAAALASMPSRASSANRRHS
jgi:4-amino-4-deoxy-L-arabinose transferase-like glycosyltransferase